jgi:superoxide dismutase, Cu-Zn family
MKLARIILPALVLPLAIFVSGCETMDDDDHHEHKMSSMHANAWASVTEAVAVMSPTAGSKTKGTIHFTQVGSMVKIEGTFEGLTPNSKHAIHIHEAGNISAADGTATGGHYNPEGHQHGLTHAPMRHAGDLGNLQADGSGKATLSLTVDNITVAGMKNPIVGRGVIIHAKEDDGGQPTGNAGGRISQGVIGIVKTAAK